jgi:hypothetical protein
MKTIKNKIKEIEPEYDFSNGVRGKHFNKMKEGYSITIHSTQNENKTQKII